MKLIKKRLIMQSLAIAGALMWVGVQAIADEAAKPTISVSGAQVATSDSNYYIVGIPETETTTVTLTVSGTTPALADTEKCKCTYDDRLEDPDKDGTLKYTFTKPIGDQDPVDGPTIKINVTSSTPPGEYKFKVTNIEQKYKACATDWTGGITTKSNTTASDEITIAIAKVTKISVDSGDSDSAYIKEDNGKDVIGTVKGTGDVQLRAIVNPDTQKVKDTLAWTGLTQDNSQKDLAKTSRSASAKKDIEVKVGSTSSRKGTLWIVWGTFTSFQKSGSKPDDSDVAPAHFGVNENGGQNGCLMQITLEPAGVNAVPEIAYDIKRTREQGRWMLVGTTWRQVLHFDAGTDDDATNTDEDLSPSTSDHIYSEDYPGFEALSPAVVDQLVTKSSFIEFLNIKIGNITKKGSADYPWHSVVWLQKNGDSFIRKSDAKNEIEPGAITVGTNNVP